MPLSQLFKFVSERSHQHRYPEKLVDRITEVVKAIWYLGFTSFGGPPVHFQIFHKHFVEDKSGRTPWIDEQTVRSLDLCAEAHRLFWDVFSETANPVAFDNSIKSSSQSVRVSQDLQVPNFSLLSASSTLVGFLP